ncbi:hypothetical protein P3X46_000543 [Hevea brasiliensis]|uniref:Uncharacterized protein n=2 Tax=Hevea brasiliensis TaxID=3981 RepID=A0ABQ9NBB2_HEVBR|nr:uncharacterized protein LOC110643924 isoform X2 [Hevea brasiliensis]XP_058000959.1 uncharacterized protein LOC110643924 isoform X2 [Hevea brasiliensis]XP_058000966.1 uncharacterized protein LOC110643924 isoform X2 [Hevea brasiliensis]XP_058000971.1 uncharacterized protein LOC110643924 isoform X2 [Hevea brasiliensis]KAJ9189225.1 hypothetical protein P3X46_000543 [Hevea brasiliensis]
MVGISCEQESWVSSTNLNQQKNGMKSLDQDDVFYQETDEIWQKVNQGTINNSSSTFSSKSRSNSKKKKNQVLLERYVDVANTNGDDLKRSKSLTDDDLDELKGCLDLGFGFSYDEIPELCNTLPALELCYSMSQKFLDEHHKSPGRSSPTTAETASNPIANWKISTPGDHPEDVKARLKFWAQAVACTVKLCS